MIDKKIKTEWHTLPDGRVMRASYGMTYIKGNAWPHFSITGEIYQPYTGGSMYGSIVVNNKRYGEDSFGCLHDDIAKYFPNLAPLIKFHLWDQSGIPMHYFANGLYWLQKAYGVFKVFPHSKPEGHLPGEPDPEQTFRKHCLLDAEKPLPSLDKIMLWFEFRKPVLQKQFRDTMKEFSVELIKDFA